MSQNGAVGGPTRNALTYPVFGGPPCTFLDDDTLEALLMPIAEEFRGLLAGLERQIDRLRDDIKHKDDKDDKEIQFLRDLIMGTGQFEGIDARLRSVEADRDASKARGALVLGAVLTLAVGVTVALVPIGWEIVKYLIK